MDRIGEGVTFIDRVLERKFDPNRNGRLDASEIMGMVRDQVDRTVLYTQANPADVTVADLRTATRITGADLKRELDPMLRDGQKYFAHGVELPTDAQYDAMAAYMRDGARRSLAFKERGTILDQVTGWGGVGLQALRDVTTDGVNGVGVLLEGSKPAPGVKPPAPRVRSLL